MKMNLYRIFFSGLFCSFVVEAFLVDPVSKPSTASSTLKLFSVATGEGKVTSTAEKSVLKFEDNEATVYNYGAVMTSYTNGKFDCKYLFL